MSNVSDRGQWVSGTSLSGVVVMDAAAQAACAAAGYPAPEPTLADAAWHQHQCLRALLDARRREAPMEELAALEVRWQQAVAACERARSQFHFGRW
jgi:hypothetical protein